jgi:hypothetical protein
VQVVIAANAQKAAPTSPFVQLAVASLFTPAPREAALLHALSAAPRIGFETWCCSGVISTIRQSALLHHSDFAAGMSHRPRGEPCSRRSDAQLVTLPLKIGWTHLRLLCILVPESADESGCNGE